jgi:hypothetical protein
VDSRIIAGLAGEAAPVLISEYHAALLAVSYAGACKQIWSCSYDDSE